ncbi:hypothetical protein RB597_008484 [Gaeumannomyces tritici]
MLATTTPVRDFRARETKDERRAKNRARFAANSQVPLRDTRLGSKKWCRGKNLIMWKWRTFIQENFDEADPDGIWLGLCRNEPEAIRYCQTFLQHCVDDSLRPVVYIGPEETKLERSLKAAYSVESLWKTLVLSANDTVLAEKRRADPDHACQWTLSYPTKHSSQGTAVWQVKHWIATGLRDEFDLTLEQSFIKTEATDRDLILFLKTLWIRAVDIPCSRRVRIAMHSIILLAGIGGFRPTSLFRLPYSQVQLAVVRNPQTKTSSLVAEITIHHCKAKKDVILTHQRQTISFAVVPTPCSLCCLCTFLFAAAIKDEAFQTPFASFEELLRRPELEKVDYLPLPWKHEMEGRQILPVGYHVGWPIWNRTLEVAGLREPVRFYSTRVGAGGRLDGALTGAMRSYVLNNSDEVFARSYQPRHVSADLLHIAFGDRAGKNEKLFELLRDVSLRRDENAPIYPTDAEVKSFEDRKDMRNLRAAYSTLKQNTSPEAKREALRIQARIGKLIGDLSKQKVQEKRREYFQAVDNRRAAGLSTADLQVPAINPRKTQYTKDSLSATRVSRVLCEADVGETASSGRSLVAFLQGRDEEIVAPRDQESEIVAPQDQESEADRILISPTPASRSTCLFCGQSFVKRTNLTRHTDRVHRQQGQFLEPFNCPACSETITITDAAHWSHHVEAVHGKHNTPAPPKNSVPVPPVFILDRLDRSKPTCLLCGMKFTQPTNLTRHNKEVHHKNGRFLKPFNCPACNMENGLEPCTIKDAAHWSNHVATLHGMKNAPGLPNTRSKAAYGRRCAKENNGDGQRDKGDRGRLPADKGKLPEYEGKVAFCPFCRLTYSPGRFFSRHLSKDHPERFESPFSCPECPQSGDVSLITDLFGWKCHVSEVHGGDNGALLVNAGSDWISQRGGAKRRWEDEEDDTYGRTVAAPKATKKQRLDRTALEDFIDPVLRSVSVTNSGASLMPLRQ